MANHTPHASDASDHDLSNRLRADKRARRLQDLQEWDAEFYRLQHPVQTIPPTVQTRRAATQAPRTALTPDEYERNLARVKERAIAGRNLFPIRAIIWTWLALVIFVAPFWGR